MTTTCRSWWRNCALEADHEILAIDSLEDQTAPLSANVSKIRELISSLELCHHKAERWVYNIIEAIGTGETTKGLGTRASNQKHPAEEVWQNACDALSAWVAGDPGALSDLTIGTLPASGLLASLGERSPLKEWQVKRVFERIRSEIHWESDEDPSTQYIWLLLDAEAYSLGYLNECPEQYKEHQDFWDTTVRTIIHEMVNGDEAGLSLGLAIDMLMPCHWGFVENLRIVLEAIGGKLHPERPFAACGRNIDLLPNRFRMMIVSNTLRVFCGYPESYQEVDNELLVLLGELTDIKKWLAASLDKTIRLQMNPPAKLRVMCALAGPEWIKK